MQVHTVGASVATLRLALRYTLYSFTVAATTDHFVGPNRLPHANPNTLLVQCSYEIMPETEGTQSGEGEKPIAPNRIDHLPGSSRDVQFPSLSRVASRIVKDKPRRTDSGRRVSPRSDAKAILDSLEYSDAAAIRYLETVKKAAEPWHVSLASAAFCALSWPHCPDKISELRESLEDARDNVRTMLGLGLIDTSHYCQNLTRSYW